MDQCAILSNCQVAIATGGLSKVPKKWLCRSGTQVSGVAFNGSFVGRKITPICWREYSSLILHDRIRIGVNQQHISYPLSSRLGEILHKYSLYSVKLDAYRWPQNVPPGIQPAVNF